jgi:MinD superfamily P-loop ATPase
MLVLDYPKMTKDGSITIPPFHTGHLGFVPETPVHMYLTHSQRKGAKEYSELLVTPFQRNVGEMLRLSCIMEDRPGVVERLIDAISDLNVNIVTEESASINHLNHHLVSMIVDLSSSYLPRSEPTETSIRDYGDYRGIVPLNDTRAVELFESILTK